jgi:hypothetical protein
MRYCNALVSLHDRRDRQRRLLHAAAAFRAFHPQNKNPRTHGCSVSRDELHACASAIQPPDAKAFWFKPSMSCVNIDLRKTIDVLPSVSPSQPVRTLVTTRMSRVQVSCVHGLKKKRVERAQYRRRPRPRVLYSCARAFAASSHLLCDAPTFSLDVPPIVKLAL